MHAEVLQNFGQLWTQYVACVADENLVWPTRVFVTNVHAMVADFVRPGKTLRLAAILFKFDQFGLSFRLVSTNLVSKNS